MKLNSKENQLTDLSNIKFRYFFIRYEEVMYGKVIEKKVKVIKSKNPPELGIVSGYTKELGPTYTTSITEVLEINEEMYKKIGSK